MIDHFSLNRQWYNERLLHRQGKELREGLDMATPPKPRARKRPIDVAGDTPPVANIDATPGNYGVELVERAAEVLVTTNASQEQINHMMSCVLGSYQGAASRGVHPAAFVVITQKDYIGILRAIDYITRLIEKFASPMEKVAYEEHLDLLNVLHSRVQNQGPISPEPTTGE